MSGSQFDARNSSHSKKQQAQRESYDAGYSEGTLLRNNSAALPAPRLSLLTRESEPFRQGYTAALAGLSPTHPVQLPLG